MTMKSTDGSTDAPCESGGLQIVNGIHAPERPRGNRGPLSLLQEITWDLLEAGVPPQEHGRGVREGQQLLLLLGTLAVARDGGRQQAAEPGTLPQPSHTAHSGAPPEALGDPEAPL